MLVIARKKDVFQIKTPMEGILTDGLNGSIQVYGDEGSAGGEGSFSDGDYAVGNIHSGKIVAAFKGVASDMCQRMREDHSSQIITIRKASVAEGSYGLSGDGVRDGQLFGSKIKGFIKI